MQPYRIIVSDSFIATHRIVAQVARHCLRTAFCYCMNPATLCLVVAVSTFFGPIGVARAQVQAPPVAEGEIFHILSARSELSLVEKFSRVVELDERITRVDGFDPAILTVTALSPHRIRLQAVKAGVTTLVLVDENGKTYSVEVFVEGDVRHLQSYVSRFFPDSSVTAVKVKDSIVMRGIVADPSHIAQIIEIAEQFYPKVINQMQFGSANQVRLQVKIMEAQRSKIRQFGFNWSLLTNDGFVLSNPGNLATPTGATLSSGGGNSLTYGANGLSASSLSFGLVNSNGIFRGFLEALKEEGLLRVLVESSVVADSGRPATLFSGGEFPILVPQSLGTISVEWREFGVKLDAVPIVLGKGQVILEIATEFSERDFANAASLNNTTIPALTSREANTQVRMRLGQTLMIGGLLATRYTSETDKIPVLGELPVIGAAFRRVKYDETETELIILVTPEYVAPLNPDQVPAGGPGMFSDVPTDHELFMQGLLEVPNYGGPTPPPPAGEHCPTDYPIEQVAPTPSRLLPQIQGSPASGMLNNSKPYGPDDLQTPNDDDNGRAMPLLPMPTESQKKTSSRPIAPAVKSIKHESTSSKNSVQSAGGWYQSDRKKKPEPSAFSRNTTEETKPSGPPALILPGASSKQKENRSAPVPFEAPDP